MLSAGYSFLRKTRHAGADSGVRSGFQTMNTPDYGNPGPEKKGSMQEDCIPVSLLAMPDEGEQMQTPAVGDKVSYNIDGTVTRIEGDQAYIKRDAINGQKVDGAEPKTEESEMAELEQMATQMPERT